MVPFLQKKDFVWQDLCSTVSQRADSVTLEGPNGIGNKTGLAFVSVAVSSGIQVATSSYEDNALQHLSSVTGTPFGGSIDRDQLWCFHVPSHTTILQCIGWMVIHINLY